MDPETDSPAPSSASVVYRNQGGALTVVRREVLTVRSDRLRSAIQPFFSVSIPPLPEQLRIAAYLDASCAAIDVAVAAKRGPRKR